MKGPPGRRAANTEPDHPSPPSATPEAIAQADRERKKRYKKSTHFLELNAGMGWPLPAATLRLTKVAESTKAATNNTYRTCLLHQQKGQNPVCSCSVGAAIIHFISSTKGSRAHVFGKL
jgi:hypothetical protein